MLALDNGIPKVLNIKQALEIYIRFQCEVIERRTKFDLEKSRNRMHILEGLIKAVNNIDEVIRIIREQKTVDLASAALIAAFGFSEAQAKAILEMRMYRLVGLEIEKLENELTELKNPSNGLNRFLQVMMSYSKSVMMNLKKSKRNMVMNAVQISMKVN